jgi:hypothetical protein
MANHLLPRLLLARHPASLRRRLGRQVAVSLSNRHSLSSSSSSKQPSSNNDNENNGKGDASPPPPPLPPSPFEQQFWTCPHTRQRTNANTLRCLAGCSIGDMSVFWFLTSLHVPMHITMPAAMLSGLSTSLALETVWLRREDDSLGWKDASQLAFRMSFVSMLSMEGAENAVDWYLTGGVVDMTSSVFWLAIPASLLAGFLVPWPYNYYQLKRYGRSCH